MKIETNKNKVIIKYDEANPKDKSKKLMHDIKKGKDLKTLSREDLETIIREELLNESSKGY